MNVWPARGNIPAALLIVALMVGWTVIQKDLILWGVGEGGCLVCLVFILADWWVSRRAMEKLDLLRHAENVQLMQMYKDMTPDQQANLHASRIIVDVVMNLDVREVWMSWRGSSRKYTEEAVWGVWAICTETHFATISTWGEGTVMRTCARELAEHFLSIGILWPPAGNQPAKWREGGYQFARKALWGE